MNNLKTEYSIVDVNNQVYNFTNYVFVNLNGGFDINSSCYTLDNGDRIPVSQVLFFIKKQFMRETTKSALLSFIDLTDQFSNESYQLLNVWVEIHNGNYLFHEYGIESEGCNEVEVLNEYINKINH
jgi:hypothetical protein